MDGPYPLDLPGRAPRYATSFDRLGGAIAAGGAMVGVIASVLTAASAASTPLGPLLALPVGTVLGGLGIVAVGGIPWLVLHRLGARGPRAAILLGAGLTFLILLVGQTGVFGAALPPSDGATASYRWQSAILTAAALAPFGGGIAFVMWWVGYRRTI